MTWTKEQMADEVISLISDYSTVNLGIGLPTAIAERMPAKKGVVFHSENGVLGVSGRPKKDQVSPTLINAGKETIAISQGASFFDSSLSFGMIRGGHIDFSILGGMEVDAEGSLANWMVPGKKVTGMGGAMDLVNGSKNIFVMMTHFTKDGQSKLLKKCTLPLTGVGVVTSVITDYGVFTPQGSHFKVIKLAKEIPLEKLGMPGLFQ